MGGVRNISIMEDIFKVLEAIPAKRVEMTLEKGDILPKRNYAFAKGQSLENITNSLSCVLEEAVISRRPAVIVSYDIYKFFDSIWRPLEKTILKHIGIPSVIVDLWEIMHNKVSLRLKTAYGTSKSWPRGDRGLPQGSILSPLASKIFCSGLQLALDKISDEAGIPGLGAILYFYQCGQNLRARTT
jgi:hypothetical protein